MFRILLVLLFLLSIGNLFGQNIVIRGHASAYAGKELQLYTFPEPISHQQKKMAQSKVGVDGSFQLSFTSNQTIEVYVDLEKYKGSLVVKPGETYEVVLPPYSPRTNEEKSSPYFEPTMYWLGLKELKIADLNFLVRSFLMDYNKELACHTTDLYQTKSSDTVKAIIGRLEKNHPDNNEQYLKTLKKYSYGELEFIVHPSMEKIIEKKYFSGEAVSLSHPAYQHLFSLVYSDYFKRQLEDIRLKRKLSPEKGDFSGTVNKLKLEGYQTDISELVAAKWFYDGYYSSLFKKENMLKGMEEAANRCSYDPLKSLLPEIIQKIYAIREGGIAPALALKSPNNETVSLRGSDKYIYLNFFRSNSRDSRMELDSLVNIEKRLRTVLTVISVSTDDDFSSAEKLWKEKKYPWLLAKPLDKEKVLADFKIRTVPLFYLLSSDQRLVLSPALSPTHNFEALFLKILRDNRFRKPGRVKYL